MGYNKNLDNYLLQKYWPPFYDPQLNNKDKTATGKDRKLKRLILLVQKFDDTLPWVYSGRIIVDRLYPFVKGAVYVVFLTVGTICHCQVSMTFVLK